MAKTSEAEFQKQVIALARELGWRVAHFRGVRTLTPDGRMIWMTPVQGDGAGFPDTLLLRGPRIMVIELKIEGGVLDDAQSCWLAAFAQAGVEWHIFFPWQMDEIETCLR